MNQLPERRRDVRLRLSLPTFRKQRSELVPCQMVDATYRGVLLRMMSAPQVNELVALCIHLPTGPLLVHAVVVRVVDPKAQPTEVALRFFALNGADKNRWQAVIAERLATRLKAA